MSRKSLLRRIVVNPKVMVGKPVIRGTRVTVERILSLLAQGMNEEELMREFPHITVTDVRAALEYAARLAASEEVIPAIEGSKR
jgi:uncharacterized protein (DUF433 family)